MKAYTHPSGHLRLSLTKEEADLLRYLLLDYEEMLASFDAENLGHGDLGKYSDKLRNEIHRSMNHADVKNVLQTLKNQEFKSL